MRDFYRFLIRVSAFLRKEIFEILRQPRLIFSLVVGPFLILFLFGVGYRNEARALRTVFVVSPESALAAEIERNAPNLGPQLVFEGTTGDLEPALAQLSRQEIDLVAVAPPNIYSRLRENEQATFELYHNELDPFQADYVRYFGRIYIDEVNRRILQTVADRGQGEAERVREQLDDAERNATLLRVALEAGDEDAARVARQRLDGNVASVERDMSASLDLLDGLSASLGSEEEQSEIDGVRASLTSLREHSSALAAAEEENELEREQSLRETEVMLEQLSALNSDLDKFNRVNSRVLVSPFRSQSTSIAAYQPTLPQYFSPSVIVLLLQHLAVTFAALSIVGEIQVGAVELFRVAPISAGETLAGKYLSYLIFGGAIAAILTALIVGNYQPPIDLLRDNNVQIGLGVPMNGDWLYYGLVTMGLLFASLGYGFLISLVVETDSQAVQYSMIVLLTSVFFSGFFLALGALWTPVRVVSWLLPATYAIELLRTIMLRGVAPDWTILLRLYLMGSGLYALCLVLLKRRMRQP